MNRVLKRIKQFFFINEYAIYYRKRNQSSLLFENKSLLTEFKKINNPKHCWSADPFVIKIADKNYVFAEIAKKSTRKGNIGYLCLEDNKPRWKICFTPSFHISFPNVYLMGDHLYCIPETNQDHCIGLYQIDKNDFSNWQKTKTILQGPYFVDSCLLKEKENHYLFTYEGESATSESFLTLRKMEDMAHPMSKIKDKDKKLRPAGNAFEYKNNMILPCQDCSKIYGGGIIFYQFENELALSKRKILETITSEDIKKYLKIKNAVGCHTYNYNSEIEIIDVVIHHFSFLGFIYKIRTRLKEAKK